MVFGSNDNVVEENQIGGNVNGVYIDATGNAGNVIRHNSVFGNPPGQLSKEFGAVVGADIQDMSSPGANTFEDNRCLTYAGAMTPAPCPQLPDNDAEAQGRESGWPSSAAAQTQNADVGLFDFGAGTTLAGAAALLMVALAVPKRRSPDLSRKN